MCASSLLSDISSILVIFIKQEKSGALGQGPCVIQYQEAKKQLIVFITRA